MPDGAPKRPGADGYPPALRVVLAAFSLGGLAVTRLTGPIPATAIVAAYIAYLTARTVEFGLLPESDRSRAERTAGFERVTEALASSNWFAGLGWLLLLVAAPFAWWFFRVQHKRIVKQGDELAQLRSKEDPDRLSSRDYGGLNAHIAKQKGDEPEGVQP